MARADPIFGLVKASRTGDDAEVRRAVKVLAADERTANGMIMPDRLLAVLQMGKGRDSPSTPVPVQSSASPLIAKQTPVRRLGDVMPEPPIQAPVPTNHTSVRSSGP